ncbi:hypothetical protein CISG_01645 [Coccidioides immitis RMSCC 3703]|uniref:Uncharacterized protein n=1 Tax=Coccidioides immitis RMSCC 3703 TaxID=454286 RepID=A0A0J8R2R8_COCIT|nr:hypothetical protein CISG_01645 [Coccidioides immitis RMSCC 3703]
MHVWDLLTGMEEERGGKREEEEKEREQERRRREAEMKRRRFGGGLLVVLAGGGGRRNGKQQHNTCPSRKSSESQRSLWDHARTGKGRAWRLSGRYELMIGRGVGILSRSGSSGVVSGGGKGD